MLIAQLQLTVYVLAMVGHLKNVSPTFVQIPNRGTNVEFTTVSPHYCQYDVSGSLCFVIRIVFDFVQLFTLICFCQYSSLQEIVKLKSKSIQGQIFPTYCIE